MNEDFKKKKSEYLLELALEEQLENDPEILNFKSEDELETPHVFSKEHEKKMKEIFRAASRAERKAKNRKYFQRMAAGVAIMLCLSGFTVMNVEAFRVPVVEFLLDISEKYSVLQEKNNAKMVTKNYQDFEPTYVPSEFYVDTVEEDNSSFFIYYISDNKQWYRLTFYKETISTSIDTENADVQEINIDGNKAIYVKKDGVNHIVMYKKGTQYQLSGTISFEEICIILKSIK